MGTRQKKISLQRKRWETPEVAVLAAEKAENSPTPSGSDGLISMGS